MIDVLLNAVFIFSLWVLLGLGVGIFAGKLLKDPLGDSRPWPEDEQRRWLA